MEHRQVVSDLKDGEISELKEKIKKVTDLSKKDDKGMSLFHHFCEKGRLDVTKFVLEELDLEDIKKKELINQNSLKGKTPLMFAVQSFVLIFSPFHF